MTGHGGGGGFRPRRSLGQNFLEENAAARVLEAIGPDREDVILEIGAGTGQLTAPLARRVKAVVAVEPDPYLCRRLAERRLKGVQVVEADYLEVNLRETLQHLGVERIRAVGNLPYRVASPIFRKLLAERELLRDLTLMFQAEVAERLVARPGTRPYGVLSVLTQRVAEVRRLLSLPPQAFRPRPKVHSALVRVTFRSEVGSEGPEPALFEELVKGLLAHRRKNIANNLRHLRSKRLAPDQVLRGLQSLSLDPGRRAETLSVADFEALSRFCAS